MSPLRDRFSRVIDYLRISVTDKCMLRCVYCMPPEGVPLVRHQEILSYEEIIRITRIAASLGVRKVRLTGGEPLVRRDLCRLISGIRSVSGIRDLSLTTNGILLDRLAADLRQAGLDRVNVSIDSFRPDRYRDITRGGDLRDVLRGIDAALQHGLKPLKINMVPIRGINDDEIPDFARRTIESDLHVRFIECMPTAGSAFWSPDRYVTTDEIRSRIESIGPLSPVRIRMRGPSKYYRLPKARGVIGFISALTHHFCRDCNRLRLTADGKLRPCLFSESEIDLRASLRSSVPDDEIERLLRLAIAVKPEGHRIGSEPEKPPDDPSICESADAGRRPMSKIGG